MNDAKDFEPLFLAAELGGEFVEIDLHDSRDVDSGIHELDEFINHAFMEGDEMIKVIHGKGEGRMREAVQDYLKDVPFVEEFRDAQAPVNAMGVTLVRLSRK